MAVDGTFNAGFTAVDGRFNTGIVAIDGTFKTGFVAIVPLSLSSPHQHCREGWATVTQDLSWCWESLLAAGNRTGPTRASFIAVDLTV